MSTTTVNIPSIEAVTYGRGVLEREIQRLQDFEAQAQARGDAEAALRWRRTYRWAERMLGDGTGCVITAFDARWLDESFRSTMGEAFAPCVCDEGDA